jgi:hypothetical protein
MESEAAMNESTKPRNRRSLRNLRFMKGSKLRIVFALMTAGMILSAGMLVSVMADVERGLRRVPAADPALANLVEQIHDAVSGALATGLVLSVVSAVLALLFGLLVSHRFYGPLVPLSRHLRELGEGKFASRVRLRPGDELIDLMEAQNLLAERLEERFGGPRP